MFETDLKKAGLSDKEAAVYVAALALGPSAVQPIARRAKIARGTTYIVLDRLEKQGLILRRTAGKRTVFAAESPQKLLHLMDRQSKKIEQDTQNILDLLPKLNALCQQNHEQTVVRYYSGLPGLSLIRQEMVRYSQPGDIWRNLVPLDRLKEVFGDAYYVYSEQRMAKRIFSQTIFSTTSPELREELLAIATDQLAIRRFVSPEDYNSCSGFTVYRDRVAIGNFSNDAGGVIIESPSVALMMQQYFDLFWRTLQ